MKTRAALLFFSATLILHAADSKPFVFSGVIHEGPVTRVALTASTDGGSKWVEVGQQYQGYQVVSYDEHTTTLFVRDERQTFEIVLQKAKILPLPSSLPPEVRDGIRNNLRQLWTAAQQYFVETGRLVVGFNDLVGEGKYIKAIEPVSGEDYTRLVFNAGGRSAAVITASGETVSFTDVLYAIGPGDTGAKIARANNLSLADLQALNPDVNWKRLKVGQVVKVGPDQE